MQKYRSTKLICTLMLLLPRMLWSQYVFDFEQALLPVPAPGPGWSVDPYPPGRWERDSVNPIVGKASLHHAFDNPGPGCDLFIIRHDPLDVTAPFTISFRIRHGYPPSSANNWQLAMLANLHEEDLEDEWITGGFVLGVNYTGSDDTLKIWQVRGQQAVVVCATALNCQEDLERDSAPWFSLSQDDRGEVTLCFAGDPLRDPKYRIASFRPENPPRGRHLVLRYEYSAAQDRKLWLDDLRVEGTFVRDSLPPVVEDWSLEGPRHLVLFVSEQVTAPDPSLISLRPREQDVPGMPVHPDSVTGRDSTLSLFFPLPLPNRVPLVLQLSGICDGDGNYLADTLLELMRNEAVWGDVVFSELMPDPEPAVGLDGSEYLELYNTSEYPADLRGWKLTVGEREYILSRDLDLSPGAFRVIREVSLPNDGEVLGLYSGEGVLVHAARYSIPFDAPSWKKEGGWSLESPAPDLACRTSYIWEYSEDRSGGTPGRPNSVSCGLEDREAPVFLYAGYGEEESLRLYFSETVRLSQAGLQEMAGNLRFFPGDLEADSLWHPDRLAECLACRFAAGPSSCVTWRIRGPGIPDCAGNLSRELDLEAGAVTVPAAGSAVINEIMYDPRENAPEFIELFNPGPGCLDLADLALGVGEEAAGAGPGGASLVALSEHSRFFGPGEYPVLCRNVEHLREAYGLEIAGNWVELKELTRMPDGGGMVFLCDRAGNTVDRAVYGDPLHMDLIGDPRGISLERLAWDRPGSDPSNWHSAASIVDYATPGRPNSQSRPSEDSAGALWLEPRVFSPDNNGYRDLLFIRDASMEEGSIVRLWITDPRGRVICILANNHVAGPSAGYCWDGEGEGGGMAPEGIYIVHLRGYHPASGRRWEAKAAAALIYP